MAVIATTRSGRIRRREENGALLAESGAWDGQR